VAVEKARQHEELKETKGMVGARTALAWMGMASSAWRHSIEGHATNIRAAVTLLQPKLGEIGMSDDTLMENFREKLALIDSEAQLVLQKPITPPLRDEESDQRIIINDLIHERMMQLWRDEPYKSVAGPYLHLEKTTNRVVWGSLEWLRLALDLVVDNAVEAMAETAVRRLTITTYDLGQRVDIAIQDSGPGIDPELLPHLFKVLPDRPGRDGHLGRGLLMVQAIMQTYRGDIRVGDTGSNGTTMILSLPLSPE
jgi:C4-dicarboxylate-specific signal transduction histidine kinase